MSKNDDRLHAFDAIRASALILGIVLHGALSFADGVDDRLWPVHDGSQSAAASTAFFLIHIFRMPLFFFVAGFSSRILWRSRGEAEFWRNRARRIAIPLVGGWVICSLALVVIVAYALARRNGGILPAALPPEIRDAGFSFLHLWFLYVLLWLYVGVSLAKRVDAWARGDRQGTSRLSDPVRWALRSSAGALLLAVPICLLLVSQEDRRWWMGVPTPAYTLIPPAVPLCIYGYCFTLGWIVEGDRALLAALANTWRCNFLIGGLCAIACLGLAGTHMTSEVITAGFTKSLYAFAYGIALVAWMLCAAGVGLKFFSRESVTVRYIADASYWMYIAHLPIVMLLQAYVMDLQLPWLLKLIFVIAATVALLLLSYQYWVRTTWIGVALSGRSRRDGEI